MPTYTTNFNLSLPIPNNSVDANVWGTYVNANTTSLDGILRGLANCNISSVAPVTPVPQAGTLWINNAGTTWPMQVYDGTTWVSIGTINPVSHTFITAAGFLAKQVFSNVGAFTYTPSAGMTYCIVELIGAGGGGGGVQGMPTAGAIAAQGGGAGAYAKSLYTVAQIGANQTGSIGTGGIGGSSSGGNATNGVAGTASLFGSGGISMTANGGTGGLGQNGGRNGGNAVIFSAGNSTAIGGNMLNTQGVAGGAGVSMGVDSNCSGCGGASAIGAGAASAVGNVNGNNAVTPGAGGSGAALLNGLLAYTGGIGANGICIITEFGI
jgi:hypothetical protein